MIHYWSVSCKNQQKVCFTTYFTTAHTNALEELDVLNSVAEHVELDSHPLCCSGAQTVLPVPCQVSGAKLGNDGPQTGIVALMPDEGRVVLQRGLHAFHPFGRSHWP